MSEDQKKEIDRLLAEYARLQHQAKALTSSDPNYRERSRELMSRTTRVSARLQELGVRPA